MNHLLKNSFWAIALLTTYTFLPSAQAHSGRTNAQGCHNNRSSGTYHCHNGGSPSSPTHRSTPQYPSESTSAATSSAWLVISIGDGDTLRITNGNETQTVRLACIDSPEMAQDYGQQAKERLQALLPINTPVSMRTVDTDRYGRTVAELFSQGRSINLSLVESGHAVAYRQYLSNCDREAYLDAEAIAQQSQLAFWSLSNPVMPWDFRRQNRR